MAFRMIAQFFLEIVRDEEQMEINERFHHLRLERQYLRDTSNPFTLPGEYFRKYYSFQRIIRIPGIIGIVDGFIVKFKRPSENEEAFFNYRHGHSMNVQIIVDSEYNILNIRICPGSNNDRFVWQFSEAKEYMEHLREDENVRQYYILDDSGYTRTPVLLTTIVDAPEGSPASNYTAEFLRTRCKVEQTIGVLTSVWRVINRSRQISYSPDKVAQFINSGVILHNFRRRHGIFDDIHNDLQYNEDDDNHERRRNYDYAAGMAELNRVIHEYYM